MVLTESDNESVNIKLTIEYDGTNYFGWQKQKNKPSIQQSIENILQLFFPEDKIILTGSGRTDTGVHALNQVANFKIKKNYFKKFTGNDFKKAINAALPVDISVKKVTKVHPGFNSRYSAKKRIYKYFLTTRKNPLERNFSYFIKSSFDLNLAKEFCKIIAGEHSFQYFCKNTVDKHNFKSIIYYAKIMKRNDGFMIFEICGLRFLHSMVRALTGALIMVASEKISIEEFKFLFLNNKPVKIQYVPSKGLVLDKIIY
jgi:tRNA pseudouridine38-40 synthase